MTRLELVPNNSVKLRLLATRLSTETGELEAATGLTITARVAATETATAAIGSLSYAMTELALVPGTYLATITGADIDTYLTADWMNQEVVVQVLEGTNIKASHPSIVRPTRRV